MLRIDLRAVDKSPVDVSGSIATDDPTFDGVDLDLRLPVRVSGRIVRAGSGRFYWRGRIETKLGGACRRCLAGLEMPIDQQVDVFFAERASQGEDATEYTIPEGTGFLDLADAVREELLLAAPVFAECREDCAGLCARCGKDLNLGPCDCSPVPDPRWAALERLRDTLPQGEEP